MILASLGENILAEQHMLLESTQRAVLLSDQNVLDSLDPTVVNTSHENTYVIRIDEDTTHVKTSSTVDSNSYWAGRSRTNDGTTKRIGR